MLSALAQLFDSQQLLPHAICLQWRPDLLWLHAVSDGLTALAYYSIPLALVVFAARREDLRFKWMFVLFGVFILACGTTHLMSIWTLWVPDWGVAGMIKAVTAISSVATAALLWPLIPRALAIPGPGQWERVNRELSTEITVRRAAEERVKALNQDLEERVRDRTRELESANAQLLESNVLLRREIELRTRQEQELRLAKAEAERANLAKSKFLAAASHDLRQPVQSMFLFFAALDEQARSRKVREIIDGMQQSLAGLKLLLDALLDASKLDAGTITPVICELELGPVLARLEAEYAPVAADKHLRLRAVPTKRVIRTDPVLMERILRNFIENALRYTSRGGIVVGCRSHGGRVRVAVADSGIGIPVDQREAVFDEFYQIGNPERDRSKGLGLGLAIVQRLGRLLGHEIGLRSKVGTGSCFWVETEAVSRLPPALKVDREASAVGENRDRGGLVLVVDDEPLIRRGFAAMLQTWGYPVLEAESGDAALAALHQAGARPSVIIADYRLRGGETGTEAIAKIETQCGGQRIPAIIVTGDTAPERLREAHAQGHSLLHKPVAAEELRRLIDAIVPPEVGHGR